MIILLDLQTIMHKAQKALLAIISFVFVHVKLKTFIVFPNFFFWPHI